MDIAPAIDKIVDLATKAKKTEILKAPERDGVYFLVGPGGQAKKIVADPSWHHEQLATPAELKAFIESISLTNGAIFYDEQQIVCVYDRDDRRNLAACKLRLSPQYLWLRDNSQNAMNQQTFVRTLRIMFRNCNETSLLALVRNLKFSSAGEAAGAIQQGRESMSRHIINEVRGEAAIPEEITLAIPVYENHPFTGQVICAVEVMLAEQMFKLTLLPMSLRRCVDDALEDIRVLLDADDMPPMFKGSPS